MNPLDQLLQLLNAQAGPRGATFAGRVIPQGTQPSLQQIMTQLPSESPDAEGMGAMAAISGGPLAKRMIGAKTIIPEVVEHPGRHTNPWIALNRERDDLVGLARQRGLSEDQLRRLYDEAGSAMFEKKVTGGTASQRDYHDLIMNGLRNFLATEVK